MIMFPLKLSQANINERAKVWSQIEEEGDMIINLVTGLSYATITNENATKSAKKIILTNQPMGSEQ